MTLTESRNPNSLKIDQLSTLEILQVINTEDANVPLAVGRVLPQIAAAVEAAVLGIRAGGRLIYAGAGTSGRLGILDAVECVPTFGTPPELVQGLIAGGHRALTQAVEGAEDKPQAGADDLHALQPRPQDVVVGLAASGATPYVLGVLGAANEIGATTVGIACNDPAPILEIARISIPLLVGPEVISGSTRLKAGTAQKLVLNMLSTATMIRLGKVYGNLMVDLQITNQKLARRARGIVAEVLGISPEEADALLQEAGGHVKSAIVMGLLGLSAAEARQRLAAKQGFIRSVIEEGNSEHD